MQHTKYPPHTEDLEKLAEFFDQGDTIELAALEGVPEVPEQDLVNVSLRSRAVIWTCSSEWRPGRGYTLAPSRDGFCAGSCEASSSNGSYREPTAEGGSKKGEP